VWAIFCVTLDNVRRPMLIKRRTPWRSRDQARKAKLGLAPRRRVFRSSVTELQTEKDSMAEGSEFELPVPVSKLSDDSILLEFSTARRIALIARKLQYYRR
jgi:hypothetical protein